MPQAYSHVKVPLEEQRLKQRLQKNSSSLLQCFDLALGES